MLAAGPPPEQVPEHERTNWILSLAMQIQNEIMNVDLNHMLEGASVLGAPVNGRRMPDTSMYFVLSIVAAALLYRKRGKTAVASFHLLCAEVDLASSIFLVDA